jgi:beta-aspartyl-peptidase (threonine type)
MVARGITANCSPAQLAAKTAAMTEAMRGGYDLLAQGGSSLGAVEATIRSLENSGDFDAGRGAYYARDGVPELDAAIMDGKTLNAGAVAAVKRIANPISLARLVMEKTPHVLLVGEGAEEFAKSQGAALVSPYYFYNELEWKRY